MFKRFFLSKRAESDHPMWQTVTDIVLFFIVATTFAIFGTMVIQDQRVHQIYYSKDLSLLQDAIFPAHEYLSMKYTGYELASKSRLNLKFQNYTYEIDENYTSVKRKWPGNIILSKKETTVSYIHLRNNWIDNKNNLIILNNPDAINFTNSQGRTKISTGAIQYDRNEKCNNDAGFLKKGYKTYIFPANLRINYEQILSVFSPNYISSLESIELDKKKENENSYKDWSLIAFETGQINRITIYYPMNEDNSIACALYNKLMTEDKLRDRDVRLIPSNNVKMFKDRYKLGHNVLIEVNPELEDIGIVMKNLASLARP